MKFLNVYFNELKKSRAFVPKPFRKIYYKIVYWNMKFALEDVIDQIDTVEDLIHEFCMFDSIFRETNKNKIPNVTYTMKVSNKLYKNSTIVINMIIQPYDTTDNIKIFVTITMNNDSIMKMIDFTYEVHKYGTITEYKDISKYSKNILKMLKKIFLKHTLITYKLLLKEKM